MQNLIDLAAGIDSSKLEEATPASNSPTENTFTNGEVSNGGIHTDFCSEEEALVNGEIDLEPAEAVREQEFVPRL